MIKKKKVGIIVIWSQSNKNISRAFTKY